MVKIAAIHRTIFKQVGRSCLIGIVVLVLSIAFFNHQSVYAKSLGRSPEYQIDYCLRPQVTAYVTGPNSVDIYADIFSTCPANTAGSFNVGIKITDCTGIGTNADQVNLTFQVGTNGIPFTQELEANAGCVVCVNHVPVRYPSFHLQINEGNIAGAFVLNGIAYRAYASPASASTTEYLSNNPPEVFPPCP